MNEETEAPAVVLLVDTPEWVGKLRSALLETGYTFIDFANPKDIKECIAKEECDVVVFDLEFASLIGVDVLGQIAESNTNISAIALSSEPSLEKVLAAWDNAASFFLVKPLDGDRAVRALRDAVENKRFYERMVLRLEQLQKANKELRLRNDEYALKAQQSATIDKIAKSIASCLDLDKLLSEILVSIAQATEFDRVVLSLTDWERKVEEAVMAMGVPKEDYEAFLSSMVWPLAGEQAAPWAEQVVYFKKRYLSDGDFGRSEIARRAASAFPGPMAKIPLVVKDIVVGTITVDNCASKRPITENDTAVLERFSEYAAIAIMNAKLYMRAVEAHEELKKAQQRLLEAERLAAIERIVATVNHEINNPLCSILLSVQMLESMVGNESEALKRQARLIMQNAEQIASIVKKLERMPRASKAPRVGEGDLFDLHEFGKPEGSEA